MTDHGLDLAVIGNGRTAALVDPTARLVWWCYPRFDSDPIFCRLLSGDDEKGFSDVVLDDMVDFKSEYLRNTAVVSTVLTDRQGGAVRITDFAPRYRQFGRVFRPPQLIRIIEPVAGLPRITIRFRPTHDYGHPFTRHSVGSNHIRYIHEGTVIRAHHRRAAVLHRARGSLRAHAAAASRLRRRRAVSGRSRNDLPRILRSHHRLLDGLGRAVSRSPTTGRTRSSAPRSRSSSATSRRPAASSRPTPPRFRRRRAPGAPGTIVIAGCATPISS